MVLIGLDLKNLHQKQNNTWILTTPPGGYGYPIAESLTNNWSSNKTAFLRRNYISLEDNIVCNQADGDDAFHVSYTSGTFEPGWYKMYVRLGKDISSPVINITENNNNKTLLTGFSSYHPAGNESDGNMMKFETKLYVKNESEGPLEIEILAVSNDNQNYDFGFLKILQGGYIVKV